MQLIVLDLEWNQPTSYQSAAYRRVGDRLLFEVIQFGAAKLDEGLEIVDTISIPVNPTHYQTIHPARKAHDGSHAGCSVRCPRLSGGDGDVYGLVRQGLRLRHLGLR